MWPAYLSSTVPTTRLPRFLRCSSASTVRTYRQASACWRSIFLNSSPVFRVDPEALPAGWRSDLNFTRQMGTDLLNCAEHLSILVPCAIVPFTWNVLVNPRHSDIAGCTIVLVTNATFDARLIS